VLVQQGDQQVAQDTNLAHAALPGLTVFAFAQAMIARTLYRIRRGPTLMNGGP
jgi:hypothetical protein